MRTPLPNNKFLLMAAVLSMVAAVLHIAIIIGGPDWYRFFGAGEAMAKMAEAGELQPTLITIGIATVLFSWGFYALSASGKAPRMPLIRTALVVITTIYLLRGLSVLFIAPFNTEFQSSFWIWSSAICTFYGLAYAIGTWQQWPYLSIKG